MKIVKESTVEICNGFTLLGPSENLDSAKAILTDMEKEMKQTYKEYMSFSGESAAMDARDDVFFDEYEDKFKKLGYTLVIAD